MLGISILPFLVKKCSAETWMVDDAMSRPAKVQGEDTLVVGLPQTFCKGSSIERHMWDVTQEWYPVWDRWRHADVILLSVSRSLERARSTCYPREYER